MALGKRRQKRATFWVDTSQLQARGRHPFYSRLNEILEGAKFDTYAERICRKYYAKTMGRPSIAPGVYFRCFLMGYFEGIDSERGIAYRVSDSLSLREFLGLSLEEQTPDHSTLSKTRRLMNLGTHEAMFRWVLKRLAAEGLLSGESLGVDSTSMRTTLAEAGCTVTEMAGQAAQADAAGPVEMVSEVGVERVVADKGYHSKQSLQDLAEVGVRTVIAEPERKRQKWSGQSAAQAAVYANRRRLDTQTAQALMRRRGELSERTLAQLHDTGGMRKV